MKYFVVSDVHDHFTLLKEELVRNGFGFDDPEHILILCGDAFVYGPEPGKMYEFLKDLADRKKLIYVYGNHELELVNSIQNRKYKKVDKTCASLLVEHFTGLRNLDDEALSEECIRLGFPEFIKNTCIPYYELKDYVFCHGFIPTLGNEYDPDWRNASPKRFAGATRKDGLALCAKHHIRVPDKTIVCGHFSAARGYKMKNATPEDWEKKIYKDVSDVPKEGFRTYFGDGFILLDPSVKKTGIINCIVIEE